MEQSLSGLDLTAQLAELSRQMAKNVERMKHLEAKNSAIRMENLDLQGQVESLITN